MKVRTVISLLWALTTWLLTAGVALVKPTPTLVGHAPQATNPPYLAQFPSIERIKADVRGVDAMETAAKQAGIFWQLHQLIYNLAYSQRRTDRQFSPDEQRMSADYRNAYYVALQTFEGKVGGADKTRWFELHTKYEMDLWLLDEVMKEYFTPELRKSVYVALKGEMPTTNAPEGSRLTPSAASLAAAARPSTSTPGSSSQPSTSAGLSADDYVVQGKKYADANDFEKAIEAFKKAIALNPSHARALFLLAAVLTYNVKGQRQLAVSTWKQFLALQSPDIEALEIAFVALGNAYRGLGQYEEALKAFRSAIDLKPNADRLASIHEWVGWVYLDMKEFENALTCFQEALRLDTNSANAHRDLGVAYYHLKQYPQALTSLQRAIDLKPDNANAHLWLGTVYLKLGRKDDALQVYNRLLTLNKETAQKLYADINSDLAGRPQSVKTPASNSPKSNQSQSSSSQGGGPAAGPQGGEPTKGSVRHLSASEIAALQARAERGELSAQKMMVGYLDMKLHDADFGSDVDDDVANYLKWLRKAAENGDVDSQSLLGFSYDRGIRAPKNVEEGRKWLHKAARQGSAAGLEGLCISYTDAMEITKGVDPSHFPLPALNSTKQQMTEAFDWCVQAANTGRPRSTYMLGILYATGGADIKPDYEQAYFWLMVRHQGTLEFRNAVANQLPADRRMEIEKRASLWKPKQTPAPSP